VPVQVAGADVWKGRWVVVVLEDGRFHRAFVAPTIAETVAELAETVAIGIDMPIGLPHGGARRPSDGAAREFVGPRRNSVFFTPSAEVLDQATLTEANVLARGQGWPGITAQAFALKKQIQAVQPLAAVDERIWEVHPEVSFAEASGGPLEWAKSCWNGVALRRGILEAQGVVLPDDLGLGGKADVADVLDAAIAAWSAARIAGSRGLSLPAGSQRIGAIWR
jgi:predicted RNase H-like nuclease